MRNHTMIKFKLARPMLAALAAWPASAAFNGFVFADDARAQALKSQMRIMQQQMHDLEKQIESLSSKPAAPPAAAAGPTAPKAKEGAPAEPKFEQCLKGFYGTLDVSFDDVTKGIRGKTAYAFPTSGAPPYVSSGPKGTQIVGSVGWIGDLSTK